MHVHRCEVCLVEVAMCGDSCQHDGKNFCSLHHPDPEHHIEPAPPPPRYAVLVKEPAKE